MSDDATRRLDPADMPEPGGGPGGPRQRGIAWGLAIVALLTAIAVMWWFVASREARNPVVDPSPTSETPTVEPSESESPEPSESTEATETSDDEPRDATDADAAEFSQSFRPPRAQAVQSVTADIDNDGSKEVIVASIQDEATRIDVARWDGYAYRVVYTGRGGGAERIDDFKVSDYTDNGSREIVTMQSIGAQGYSLSIWGWNGQAIAPQRGSGGCWNGSHTFGVTGASIRSKRIRATCDGSPLPTAAWPSDIYEWTAVSGWTYVRTEE